MADISRLVLESIHAVTTLVEKDDLQLNRNQCRHLAVCLRQVKDCLFSIPIHIYGGLLERVRRTVKEVENFVIKCNNKDWLVNALSIGVSEEETKDLVLELRWCLDTQFNHSQGPLATLAGQGQWAQPQMVLPSEEDIRQDKKCLIDKLQVFLLRTSHDNEKHYLAMYLQGRLQILEGGSRSILEGGSRSNLSLEGILWKLKLPEPSKHVHLGAGSSALVFKASWLGVPCAKKSLYSGGDKFRTEAGTLAMLNHPNIVTLYCCYEDKKNHSLMMELMDRSLYDLLEELRKSRHGSPFDLDVAVEILLQIVKGMLYLHRNGFAHRDLKSLNILVSKTQGPQTRSSTGDFVVKVSDFESVKLFDPTRSNLLSTTPDGTFFWKAPEVLGNNGERTNPRRSDIFSFAMVCYEILTDEKKPFESYGIVSKELTKKIVHDGLRPTLPDDCPVELKTLIENCWDEDCARRPDFDEIYHKLLRLRSSLMLETSVVETQPVQGHIMREPMTFIKMCRRFASFSTNVQNLDASSTLQQAMKEHGTSMSIDLAKGGLHRSPECMTGNSNVKISKCQRPSHRLPFGSMLCLVPKLDNISTEIYVEELDKLDKAINVAPTDLNALRLRSEIKSKLQDFEGSLEDLNKLDAIQPNDALTLKRRGQIKHILKDNEGALKDLDGAMKIISNDARLLNLRAQVKKMLGDYKGALEDLNTADDLAPHDALILSLRGEMKKNLKHFGGALQDLNEANDLARNDVYILNERSQVKSMIADLEGAQKDLVKASRLIKARRLTRGPDHTCREFPCPFCSMSRGL